MHRRVLALLLVCLVAGAPMVEAEPLTARDEDRAGDVGDPDLAFMDLVMVEGTYDQQRLRITVTTAGSIDAYPEGQGVAWAVLIDHMPGTGPNFTFGSWDLSFRCMAPTPQLVLADCSGTGDAFGNATLESVDRTGDTLTLSVVFAAPEQVDRLAVAATAALTPTNGTVALYGFDFTPSANPMQLRDDARGESVAPPRDPWYQRGWLVVIGAAGLLGFAVWKKATETRRKQGD